MQTKLTQKFLWIALGAAVVVGFIWQIYPLPDAKNRMSNLPLAGLGYLGMDVPETEFELKFFKDVNVLKRVYRVDHENYFITVLDGTRNRHVVHDPYYCFTGSGWTILHKQKISLGSGEGEQLIISKNNREKSAVFWFTDGISTYTSPMEYWWKSTLRRLTLGRSGQESLLVMIQPIDTNKDVDWNTVIHVLKPLVTL